ncbi:MAG: hypothetical protein KFF73_01360 [Cyclobacteriaceae bacterium]|nr:hypothetical protein [Cyclobacteriaceae bacterium]
MTVIIFVGLSISCDKNDITDIYGDSILPENFMVEIPAALSNEGNQNGRIAVTSLNGNVIYGHLSNFIHVGQEAAIIVEEIIRGIAFYRINRPMELSFESADDGRMKNLVVVENSSSDGQMWEFQLTITDAVSETNDDGGKALQVFWNRLPIEGFAILKPSNIDRIHYAIWEEAIVRIEYSETGELGYDAQMTVKISDIPLKNPLDNPFSMHTLKMFAGKSGNTVDIFGNSDHPNALFFSGETGFNWAFVASGDAASNIGVAEVGLPHSILDTEDREVLLKDYAIKNVFTSEINAVWPDIDPETLETLLDNTDAPGYFSQNGFVAGGISPGAEYDHLELRLPDMSPYNPVEISGLSVWFKE